MIEKGSRIANEIMQDWYRKKHFKKMAEIKKKKREKNMKIIIMCGGEYDNFKKPKQLSVINGEMLVERTIRLLKENNFYNIFISSNDSRFNQFGVKRLEHENSYKVIDGKIYGYWIDAYYPLDEPCIYLHGDVYYTENAIKKILNYNPVDNTFIGNKYALNKEHKNVGEPFGWIIIDQNKFRQAIEETKKLQDEGKLERGYAISWELYRVHNGTNPNYMLCDEKNYLCIDDETIDIDAPYQIEELDKKIKEIKKRGED